MKRPWMRARHRNGNNGLRAVPPKDDLLLHQYFVSVSVEREGRPISFQSSIIRAPHVLASANDFNVVAGFFRGELVKREPEAPEPRVTVITPLYIGTVRKSELDAAQRRAVEDAQAEAAGPVPVPEGGEEPQP